VETALFFAAALFYDIRTLTPASQLYAMIVLTAVAMGLLCNRAAACRSRSHDHSHTLRLTGIAADPRSLAA